MEIFDDFSVIFWSISFFFREKQFVFDFLKISFAILWNQLQDVLDFW